LAQRPGRASLASDAQETASKFKTVFGRETGRATKVLDEFSRATGTSRFELKEQAAQFQALIRPMGLSTKGASDMSLGMTKLATDLASFNNSSVEEAMTALQSGLVGESEPLRRFGVQLSAARIEAFAYAEGIAKQGKELTAAQKAQASYGIILKDTKLAQGDAVKTADSFANQFKRLKSQVTDAATSLGVVLLPAVTSVIGAITGFISKLRDGGGDAGRFGQIVGEVFEKVKGAVGTAVEFLRGQFDAHRDDFAKVGQAVTNIGIAYREVWEHVILPIIKRVLPAIVQIIKGAFDVIGGLVKTLSSLLTGDFRGMWDGIKQIFRGALQIAIGIVRGATAGIREAAAAAFRPIANVVDGVWEDVKGFFRGAMDWIRERFDDFKRIAGNVAKPFVDAFKSIGDQVEKVLGFFEDVIGAVQKVIDFIGKIKIPKISLPFGIGGSGGGNVGPGKRPSSVDGFNDDAAAFGNAVTSGFRPGDDGWHGQNRARDYAGGDMLGFAKYMAANFGGALLELIHTPLGFGIKNGATVPLSFWGSAVNADHFDHVHVAMKNGGRVMRDGWALVGEQGPELAHFPAGSSVYSNGDSRAMLGAGMSERLLARIANALESGPVVSERQVERAVYKVFSREFAREDQGRRATPSHALAGVKY
jgi:hypothetical protein